ncbi:MAG: acyltransferase [Cetobacterium sp.]
MKISNIQLSENIEIGENVSLNNIKIGKNTKISKNCTFFGSEDNILEIGENSYFAMGSVLNGINGLKIGKNASFGTNVTILTDSGPNRSEKLQKIFPIKQGKVSIGDDCWVGMNSMIMPGVQLGECCIIAAGSFVTNSFPAYSIIGGTPAKLIRDISEEISSK